jgi:ABC-type arginine transport system ATPase subunit
VPGPVTDDHPLLRLWRYSAPHRGRVVLGTTLSVANKVFDVVPEILIGAAVDVIVRGDDSWVADVTGIEGADGRLRPYAGPGARLLRGPEHRRADGDPAIARAIVRDPAILVLHEATSAVDNETEAAIQRSLEHVARDRTTLVIAHRLSTVRGAHRIHVLEHGVVTESGTHDDLVAMGGLYAALWRVQTGVAAPIG